MDSDYLLPRNYRYFPRADATSSSDSAKPTSGPCISCPSAPSVTCQDLKCGKDEECIQVSQSCYSCPKYVCNPSSVTGTGSGSNIGGIVGGTVGGAAVLVILSALFYFFVWRKRGNNALEDDDIGLGALGGSFSGEELDSSYAISNMDSHLGDPNQAPLPNGVAGGAVAGAGTTEKRPSNRRLSTYESFTRPQARYANKKVQNRSINKHQQQQVLMQQQLQQQQLHPQQRNVYIDPNNSNRNSIATSISTTNASNILPIAYIPGVTVRPTKNNTRSIYSYETESVFSDLNTIENASIIGARQHTDTQQKDSTMTAIKAQPRLVNVGKIEEEDEEEDDADDIDVHSDDDDDHTDDSDTDSDLGSDTDSDIDTQDFGKKLNDAVLSHNTISEQPITLADKRESKMSRNTMTTTDESDSDVDSDLGEIVRASLGNPLGAPTPVSASNDSQPIIGSEMLNFIEIGKPHIPNRTESPQSSSHGSFLLDVDIIGPSPSKTLRSNNTTTNNAPGSPFADPNPEKDHLS